MKFCIDFDNTIQINGYPIKGAISAIKQIIDDGNEVVIWTSRGPADFEKISEWLKKFGIIPSKIKNKEYSDLYIDDRSVNTRANGWSEVLRLSKEKK